VRRSARAAALVIALGLGAWPSAQSPAQPPQAAAPPAPVPPAQEPGQRPTFRTEANFVRVDVYPTQDGKPVLDLAAADFEIAEDGVPQKVDSFEHIVVRGGGPQADRIEPSSQREMLQAAENPRHRVFVIFLDAPNVGVAGSHHIAGPIIRLINRILGPDDLVGVMTPTMSAADVVLSRRTEVTEEQLTKHWSWGSRFGLMKDDREESYEVCYPKSSFGGTADNLIARKRERVTLEALQDLVRYLNGVREERKAVLTVTEGWALYKPDSGLEKLGKDILGNDTPIPSVDPVGVGPNGKLTTKDPRDRNNNNTLSTMECHTDRQRLAAMDNEQFLLDIINDANRTNTTFYPIDPRGLVAFDTPIEAGLSLAADARSLRTHQNSMRTLADGTDGLAVMGSNDLDKGLRQISDDLSSYYLLGYYSTNAKTDGGYRTLKVRVKRPGVAVRSRRGYRAASAEEVARSRAAAAAPAVDIATPVQAALGMLAQVRPDARVRLRATPAPGGALLWIAGELSAAAGRADEWGQGATADLQVTSGAASTGARVTIKPGDRTFLTAIKLPAGAAAVDVQARISPADGGPAAIDTIRVAALPQALFYRRGPSTANRQQTTADLRFTRAERAHLEVPVDADVKPGAGRLLDRAGQPLTVPVAIGERTDEATGQRWITADVVLAPLAPADYIVEIGMIGKAGETRIVTGIRVIR
jgi:VWFA-related protein